MTGEKMGSFGQTWDLMDKGTGCFGNIGGERVESRTPTIALNVDDVTQDMGRITRHYRSVSMDSSRGRLNFNDESPKLFPSFGPRICGLISSSNAIDGISTAFSLEFGNGECSGPELKKIMANEKLAEIALTDTKHAKRILANRQSAENKRSR